MSEATDKFDEWAKPHSTLDGICIVAHLTQSLASGLAAFDCNAPHSHPNDCDCAGLSDQDDDFYLGKGAALLECLIDDGLLRSEWFAYDDDESAVVALKESK